MTAKNNLTSPYADRALLIKRALIGAIIGLVVILAFILPIKNPRPEWGQYWRLRPLIVTSLAGACGGAFYAFMSYKSSRGFNRTLAVVISLLVYVVCLWMGIVLGLDGTMWD